MVLQEHARFTVLSRSEGHGRERIADDPTASKQQGRQAHGQGLLPLARMPYITLGKRSR